MGEEDGERSTERFEEDVKEEVDDPQSIEASRRMGTLGGTPVELNVPNHPKCHAITL